MSAPPKTTQAILWVCLVISGLAILNRRSPPAGLDPQPVAQTLPDPGTTPESVPLASVGLDPNPPESTLSPAQKFPLPAPLTSPTVRQWLTLPPGERIPFGLPDGKSITGRIGHQFRSQGQPSSIVGVMEGSEAGRFMVRRQIDADGNQSYIGSIWFEDSMLAYRLTPRQEGGLEWEKVSVNQVICHRYEPPSKATENPAATLPDDHPDDAAPPAYQNGVIRLESLPGAAAVVYLDFDGEEGPHQDWGDFDAPSYNFSQDKIRNIWLRVSEDFAPFSLNVTTDLAVFEAAQETSRIRCIITPTDTAAPGAGGVAFLNSFNWSGDTPCWVFISSEKSCAEAISHEVGHTLSLSHDGSPTREYYLGHGYGNVSWAPIMGVGYYDQLTQWSKGEYADANNQEDDLFQITNWNNNVGYRNDEVGETLQDAGRLNVFADGSVDTDGLLEQSTDRDAYTFDLTQTAQVTLQADGMGPSSNLDLKMEVLDESGTLLAQDNPDTELYASISTTLPARTYLVRVEGVGRGDPLDDGYTDYGSMGYYRLSGNLPGVRSPLRFEVLEAAEAGTVVGQLEPRNPHEDDPVEFRWADATAPAGIGLDLSTGVITILDPTAITYQNLSSSYLEPAELILTVQVTNPVRPTLNETLIVVISLLGKAVVPDTSFMISAESYPGTLIGTLPLTDPNLTPQEWSFALTGGTGRENFTLEASTGKLLVSEAAALTDTTSYELGITVSSVSTPGLITLANVTVQTGISGFQDGSLTVERWDGVAGFTLADLTGFSLYPDDPDQVSSISEFSYGVNVAESYGIRVRGYLIPPATGLYTLYLASDDAGALWLSASEDPAQAVQMAALTQWSDPGEWDKYPDEQTSSPVSLEAGKRYYVEAMMKEGGGGDHLQVGWTGPGIPSITIIEGAHLAPYNLNVAPVWDNPSYSFDITRTASTGTLVGTVSATDEREEPLTYRILEGNEAGAFSIDPATGQLRVADPAELNLVQHRLVIGVQDRGRENHFPLAEAEVPLVVSVPDADSDTDLDGLPDLYELDTFGRLGETDGTVDSDGDGQSDYAEWKSGTNPNSNSDTLILIPVVSTGTPSRIRWQGKPGVRYQVEASTNLMNWTPVLSGETGTGEDISLPEPSAYENQDQRYYRILVE